MNNGEYPMYHVQGAHEAIIPQKLFDAVQRESKRRAEKFKRVKNQRQTGYTSRVFCGNCGARCRRKMRHGKPVWICDVSNTQGKSACSAKAVPEIVLDDLEEKYAVKKFTLCDGNNIEIVLETDETVTETWFDMSRSES